MIVDTYLAPSSIHGLGVFAAKEIRRGELIWNPDYERVYTRREFELMPRRLQLLVLERGYQDKADGQYKLGVDNDQFINHSDDSNTQTLVDGLVVAKRDIARGEEVTNNYYEFDLRADEKFTLGRVAESGLMHHVGSVATGVTRSVGSNPTPTASGHL